MNKGAKQSNGASKIPKEQKNRNKEDIFTKRPHSQQEVFRDQE